MSTTAPATTLWRPALSSRGVLAAAVLVAAAAVAAMAGLFAYQRSELVAAHGERNALVARVLADHAARSIDSASLATSTLVDLVVGGSGPDSPVVAAALSQTLANLPFLRAVALLDGGGRVLAAAGVARSGVVDLKALGPLPGPGREAIGPFIAGRGLPLEGGAAAAVPAGLGVIPFVRTVQVAGPGTLHVVALLNPDAFANFQQVTLNDERSAAALTTFDGHVLAATQSSGLVAGQSLAALPPFTEFLPARDHDRWLGAGLGDGTRVAAFRALPSRPLVVLVDTPRQAVLDAWLQQARWFIALGAAGVITLLALGATAGRSLRAREAARRQLDTAQAEVAARERELSVIFGSVRELLFRTDADGVIDLINPRWETATGRLAADAVGRHLADLVLPAAREAVRGLFGAQPGAAARHAQASLAGPNGTTRRLEVTVVPLMAQARIVGFAGSAVDVTDLLMAQAELRAQLAFTASLIESNPLPIAVLDPTNRYLRVNRAWEDFTGHSRRELVGTRFADRLSAAEAQRHEAQDRQLFVEGGERRYEAPFIHADGSRRDLFISKSVVPGSDGRPAGIVCAFMDVSEFREAERATREARDAAEDASRAKSEFIANISHELRTPLQSILGFSELGMHRAREHIKFAGMFKSVHDAGQRMLALVNDLLDLAKLESTVGSMQIERHDLRDLVRDVGREVAPLLAPRGLRLEDRLSAGELVAKVDPARFQQVIRNVLANAIRFSPDGAAVEIHGDATADGEIRIAVADRGPGIPPDELDLIFDAFVQSSKTKDGSGGTGLGLAISRQIMRAHDGRIAAANRDGGGAVFELHLPATRFGETLPAAL